MQLISELTARKVRVAGQVALVAGLAFAGIGHLTFAREEFRAQVPTWVSLDTDLVVLASGVVSRSPSAVGATDVRRVLTGRQS